MYQDFKLQIDLNIEKSQHKEESGDKYDNMIFSGVASDSHIDAEQESLDPNGFIYDRFLKSGLFNLDHLPSRSPVNKSRFWIGEPLEAYVKDGKFFVKGKLWKQSPEARAFWDKALEMKASGSTRKPGMSVEGKALERDPKNPAKVTKALITNVALTFTPVNDHTFLDIEKSRKNSYKEDENIHSNNILIEFEEAGKRICIDKSMNCSITPISLFKMDSFQLIYEKFQKGEISQKILSEYVKKIENNFDPTE